MKNIYKAFWLGIFIPILISCSIFRNLENIDLSNVFLDPNQKYAGLSVNKAFHYDPDNFYYSSAFRIMNQDIVTTEGNKAGGITIYLINSPRKRKEEYNFLSYMESQEGVIPYEYPPITDDSIFFTTDRAIIFNFIRCEVLVSTYIERRGKDSADAERLWSIANLIDANLENYVCE